jgi:uncharacterized membrane protein
MPAEAKRFGVRQPPASKPLSMQAGERDEYFVRRLEAFGDIVIGFSLALLGVSLIVPNHARELLSHTAWFAAYVWTFALVCSMWGAHYWTFRYVFMPTPVSLILNYTKLGLIVLLIFAVQVLLRALQYGDARDVVVANMLYWGCLTAYWIVAVAIIGVGMRLRRAIIAPEIWRRCVLRIWRVVATTPAIILGVVVAARGKPAGMMTTIVLFMLGGLAVGILGGRLATRIRPAAYGDSP